MADSVLDPLEMAFEQADADPAWRDLMNRANVETGTETQLDPAVYAAVFQTTIGMEVLRDLHRRYCNVTRWAPGQPVEAAYYREGMAQVVADIIFQIDQASNGEG